MEALDTRLQSAAQSPAQPPHRLAALIERAIPRGSCVLVLEACRSSSVTSPQQLGALAARLVAAGADAVAVRTDSDDTAHGLADLFEVCRSVPEVPVLRRDWFLHPFQVRAVHQHERAPPRVHERALPHVQRPQFTCTSERCTSARCLLLTTLPLTTTQVVDTKEAGAAGIIGAVASIGGRGTPLMSSFAAALGLDCPGEWRPAGHWRGCTPWGSHALAAGSDTQPSKAGLG